MIIKYLIPYFIENLVIVISCVYPDFNLFFIFFSNFSVMIILKLPYCLFFLLTTVYEVALFLEDTYRIKRELKEEQKQFTKK